MRGTAIVGAGLRLVAGPLALAGFFLPWAHGPGPLAASEFTGFKLVGFAGHLQQLDLTLAEGAGLWAARLAVLGVAIAALWLTLLAPAHRWHPLYAASGWYLAGAAAVLIAIGLARAGVEWPPAGMALVIGAAAAFLAGQYLLHRPARHG